MCMIFYFTIKNNNNSLPYNFPAVPNPPMCVYMHSCTQYFPNMSYVKLMNFPFDLIPPHFLISSRYLEEIKRVCASTWLGGCQADLIGGRGAERERERERDGWIRIVERERERDRLRADRQGGKTESRWKSEQLFYTKIIFGPFSTFHLKKKKKKKKGKKKEPILHIMPKKDTLRF